MKRTTVLALSACVLSITAACTADDIATCDVAQRSCQEDVYYSMLRMRNDGYDPFAGLPPIRVISEAEFRDELNAQASQGEAKGPNPWDEALRLLHLYPPLAASPDGGVDDGADIEDQVLHVYAYYDPATKNITIINHPTATDPRIAMVSLAHEFVHALQDREMDLEATDKVDTSDDYLAGATLIEGDARFYETLFTADLMNKFSTDSVLKAVDSELNDYFTHFDELGSPFFAAQMLMYPLGAKYLANKWGAGGNAAVRRAYGQAPKHSAGFFLGAGGRSPVDAFQPMWCEAPAARSGKALGIDRFGGLVFYTFLRGWNVPHPTAYALAQGWVDDQISVYQVGTAIAVSWRIELSQTMPADILNALSSTGELTLAPSGSALTIMAASPGTMVDWASSAGCL